MTEYDAELERRVRASLEAHASEVDTTVPVAVRARAAARKRRASWVAVGAAAAVAAVAVIAVVADRAAAPEVDPPVASSASPFATPGGWRAEYWHDVRIEVPDEWGWGSVPNRKGLICGGPGAIRTPADGDPVDADETVPYVGRPIMLSDLCVGGGASPQASYVWLGAVDEPFGTHDLGNGFTQETMALGDTTVTVATDDPALRERILASATVVAGPCLPSLTSPPKVDAVEEGTPKAADSLLVCAYRGTVGGTYDLVYADELGAEAAAATEDAILSTPALLGDCLNASGGEWVALFARGDGWAREYSVDLNCPGVTDAYGRMHRLERSMTDPWLVNGLPAAVYAGKVE